VVAKTFAPDVYLYFKYPTGGDVYVVVATSVTEAQRKLDTLK
jgi:hypothetical protein